MAANADFSIDSFRPRKREFRADKGKKHSYPGQRKRWNLLSHGHFDSNLNLNPKTEHITVMDTQVKQFKNPPEIRDYWRIHKAIQRAKGEKK
ncbi:MAG: hypothetical protein ABSD42_04615 [Candidatus Bathyarchaeia archaeon]|jgi:hypothetical protein